MNHLPLQCVFILAVESAKTLAVVSLSGLPRTNKQTHP